MARRTVLLDYRRRFEGFPQFPGSSGSTIWPSSGSGRRGSGGGKGAKAGKGLSAKVKAALSKASKKAKEFIRLSKTLAGKGSGGSGKGGIAEKSGAKGLKNKSFPAF